MAQKLVRCVAMCMWLQLCNKMTYCTTGQTQFELSLFGVRNITFDSTRRTFTLKINLQAHDFYVLCIQLVCDSPKILYKFGDRRTSIQITILESYETKSRTENYHQV